MTYEYACECGNEWEQDQRITDDPVRDCPKCGQPKARRQVGGAAFVLKGGGWASDSYSKS